MRQGNLPPLPTLDAQIDSLRTTGDQFSSEEKEISRLELPGVWMAVKNGTEKAMYDARIVPSLPHMIVPAVHVYRALKMIRPNQLTVNSADQSISSWLNVKGHIIGFSGYGTGGGYEYEREYEGIQQIFDHCNAAGILIDGVVDGATGYGVPGLSGVLARKYEHPTIGIVPLRGLRGAAPRDTYVVTGEEFGDEAPAIGATPDMLIAFGGGPNAEKEVETAIEMGSVVILAVLKRYPENSVAYLSQRNRKAKAAQDAGKLLVCNNLESIGAYLDISADQLHANRERRRSYLRKVLAQTD